MRARHEQFEAARNFLKQIKAPKLVIPGNHDVPLYNVVERLLHPFENYEKFAGNFDAGPLILKHVAIYGINTVNPLRHQQGKVHNHDLQKLSEWITKLPSHLWRVVVVHQHFANVPGHERPGAMPHASRILSQLSEMGVHAVLHGHVHYHRVASTAEFFPEIKRPMVLVCAGTPTSSRVRGDEASNNYNVLHFNEDTFAVRPIAWSKTTVHFEQMKQVQFDRAFFDPFHGSPDGK
jgi:3',5'-cyclic AMP phosphodiesterase CpdA